MNNHLSEAMRLAVFIRVHQLKARGGPTTEDMDEAMETGDVLGERGDVLLFGNRDKPGECAELFNRTAHAIAVLAFCPGGVHVFGTTFEANPEKAEDYSFGFREGGCYT